ncbi:hypothetical protein [Mycolicibacter heraklionensis]|uniref:hypothetical protein n=1 Tax=Mycolicibacter heraklionensis TaxID=512402 RepID=UPI0007EB6B67|nr:hypothetical protein [Mycolicibacter heraklionensis]OBG36199.1 hypothetical protein A5671_21725 [Mycolicibacter heraklionensis]
MHQSRAGNAPSLGVKVRQELDAELASASRRAGRALEWSAAERAVLELISADFDRISDLRAAYATAAEAGEVKIQVKLSTELRLLEQSVARLLRQVKTDLPAAPSVTTLKARRAANARWERERAANS